MRHPFFFDSRHAALAEELLRLRENELAPLLEEAQGTLVDDHALTRAAVRCMGAAGLLQLCVPEAYGGRSSSLDSRSLCLARESLSFCSALIDTAFAMQGLGSYPITLAGSEPLKRRYLTAVCGGGAVAAFAITEPDSGSDVASLTTHAVLDGDFYRLTGTKRFISNAGLADFYCLFARTGEPGHRGLSAFVLEADTPGLEVEPLSLMAPHPIGELHLHDCRVPRSHRLGDEGAGFKIAMQTLDRFRPSVGAAALGLGQRALEEALQYTSSRTQFGQRLSDQQATRLRLASMATDLEAARLLVFQAAWATDQGREKVSLEAAMAKLSATEAAQRVVDASVQLHGGNGVLRGSTVERLYREVRALRIYEGTSEIQQLVIASHLLKSRVRSAP